MANRTFNQFQGSLEKGVVQLYLEFTFGSSTDQQIVRGKGIASVKKTATTGVYLVTLEDTYNKLLAASFQPRNGGWQAAFNNELVQTSKTFELQTYTSAGVLAWPTDGDGAFLAIALSNSTAL